MGRPPPRAVLRASSPAIGPSGKGASSLGQQPGPALWSTIQTLCFRGSAFSAGEGDSSDCLMASRAQTRARAGKWPTSPSGHTAPLLKDRLICAPSKVPPETSAGRCFCLLRVTSALGHRESFQGEEEEEHSEEIRAPCSQRHPETATALHPPSGLGPQKRRLTASSPCPAGPALNVGGS